MAAKEAELGGERQRLDLFQSAQTLIEECRMVLPGIQAIFGFQLVAVTNTRFTELEDWEQWLHLGATAMVALAAAIVMAPAAIHRANGGREVTDAFIRTSTVLVLGAMMPLAAGLAIDFYLISRLVDMARTGLDAALGALLFALLFFIWMVFPRMRALHAFLGRERRHAT
jgi:uncharacterized protein DUF6328